MRLTKNLTDGQTFVDVLPLMNFWAGFSPSAEVRVICDIRDMKRYV